MRSFALFFILFYRKWYKQSYRELTELNPDMAIPIRGVKGTPSMVGVSYGKCNAQE